MTEKLKGVALITGASGFIGRRLRDALIEAGTDVVAIRRADSPAPSRGRSVVADYADAAGLRELVRETKPDYVFHVAGATKGVTYEDFQRANVMPTVNLAEAVRDEHPGLKRFVFISSLSAYGPSSRTKQHREEDPREPIEFYGKSKLEAEKAIEAMGNAIPWTIVRPSGVYGPGDVDYFELFKSIDRGLNVFFGNRDRLFSSIYVDDLVKAILLAATKESTRGKGYFVAEERPISWGDFQAEVVAASGRKARTLNFPGVFVDIAAFGGELLTRLDKKPRLLNKQKALMGAQDAWTCDGSAIRRDTGFAPVVDVPDGVRRTFAWYRAEKWI
jgi:UDP-glucose 4-epimerase